MKRDTATTAEAEHKNKYRHKYYNIFHSLGAIETMCEHIKASYDENNVLALLTYPCTVFDCMAWHGML